MDQMLGRPAMPLPMAPSSDAQKWSELPAKFTRHGANAEMRMQCFLMIRDRQERVAMAKLKDIEGWAFPAETMRFNESPGQAAARVATSWFTTPPRQVWLERILSFPATGNEDNRWYVIFVYAAEAESDLTPTADTEEVRFVGMDAPPGEFAFSHADVWAALRE